MLRLCPSPIAPADAHNTVAGQSAEQGRSAKSAGQVCPWLKRVTSCPRESASRTMAQTANFLPPITRLRIGLLPSGLSGTDVDVKLMIGDVDAARFQRRLDANQRIGPDFKIISVFDPDAA